MLVLSRKESESIVIGGNITVQVQRIKGKVVSLSIKAPKDVPIVRSELRRKDDATGN